ncbi:hypothetical protein ES5_14018 [Dietzia cinnamea P4]|nr:hypothetical protein ES5_14018 [Dietzia cinnamea P4]
MAVATPSYTSVGRSARSAMSPVAAENTALCSTSTANSRRGQVAGGAPTPVAFSRVWSTPRRMMVCHAVAWAPRMPVAAQMPRSAPSEAAVP